MLITTRKPATQPGVPGPITDQYALPADWRVTEIIRCPDELTFVLADGRQVCEMDLPDECTIVSEDGPAPEPPRSS